MAPVLEKGGGTTPWGTVAGWGRGAGSALFASKPDKLQLLPGQEDEARFDFAAVHHGRGLGADIQGLAQ